MRPRTWSSGILACNTNGASAPRAEVTRIAVATHVAIAVKIFTTATRSDIKRMEVRGTCGRRSGAAFYIGKIERRAQSVCEFCHIIVRPKVHEKKVRGIIDHMTVQGGHFNAVITQRLQHRVDFLAEQHEVTCDGGLAAAGGLEVNCNCRTHRRWNRHAVFGNGFGTGDAELIPPTVDAALGSK